MRHQRNRRLQDLFAAAVLLGPAEQAAFVEHHCSGDSTLRQQLEHLLAADVMPTHSLLERNLAQGNWPEGTPNPQARRPDRFDAAAARPTVHYRRKSKLRVQSDQDTMVTSQPPHSPERPVGHEAIPLDELDDDLVRPIFEPGARVYQYELIRELGRGGMGTVYLARDIKLGRRVAIKFLKTDRPTFTERFIAEAQHTARCSHENIVVIHDVSEYQGVPFMVLEYLRGQPLGKLIGKGRVPPSRAIQLMIPVVRALAFAHEQQIIHRDLKPANVFVTDSGTVKVLDFGIAKYIFERQKSPTLDQVTTTLETVPQQPELTRHGAIIGTLPYMSPEQWGVDKIDFRSDLWAVGIMLYQMVVGKHPLAPLRGEQLMVTAILEQPMPSAHDARGDMPPELADVIDGCLKKRKKERFQSADELLAALHELLPESRAASLRGDESPYAGLTAFQEADAGRFFGRSHDIATMYARLQDEPLIGVVGPSGVGKSSFVRAGVIPALKHSGETWESHVIRPGRQPLAGLARLIAAILGDDSEEATWHADDLNHHYDIIRRLTHEPGYLGAILRNRARKHDRKIILFIDQFEELYTLTPDIEQRLAFTSALTGVADDASSPLRVVLSIRSDFLDRVAEDRQFMTELHKALYFLVQPDRDGLREAIVRPAEMAGYRFEVPAIVDQMLERLETATGALPLLQFAATKLWENRNQAQRLLTQRAYQDLGGIEGALASHANAVLGALTPQEQTLVRAIFLQLVTPERTRAITSIRELRDLWHEPDTIGRLVDLLVDARLLVSSTGDRESGSLVEIVHESLIHSWPMLSHWLDENQEDAPFLEQLKAAARQWHERGCPNGLLWRGDAAREAEVWYARYRGLLPGLHRQYMQAVMALAARSARRRRLAVVGTMALLSLLVVAACVALVVISEARREALVAKNEAQTAAAEARAAEDEARAAEDEASEKEQTIRKQYDELQAEKAKKEAAEQLALEASEEVELSREQLARINAQLKAALLDARSAKTKFEILYAREKKRAEELQRLAGKSGPARKL